MVSSEFSFEEYSPCNTHHQGYYSTPELQEECVKRLNHYLDGIADLRPSYDHYQDKLLPPPHDHPFFPKLTPSEEAGLYSASAATQSLLRHPARADAYLDRSCPSELSPNMPPRDTTIAVSSPSSNLPLHSHSRGGSIKRSQCPIEGRGGLSTEEIIRVAAAHFVQFSGDPSVLNPLRLSFSGLSNEEIEDIKLANLLLATMEKVSNNQYDRARNMLRELYRSSSTTGNPVQRVVYYFSEALEERIDRETGRLWPKMAQSVIEAMLSAHPTQLVIHKKLPYLQLMQFTSVQAIIDNVASAKRIHIIDLSIRHGLQWAILIQALADRAAYPVDYLRISAVGTSGETITLTGKRLVSFAASLGIALDFKAVIVTDMVDLREDMFELGMGEVIGVYSSMDMNPMIVRPESLENLVRVIRKLRPRILTVVDVEAKHNSPSFISRFSEALFFYSSFFDCLDFFLGRDDSNRLVIEGGFHSQGIKNIVATEGKDRVVRHVGLSVWRPYFARFGFEEVELNEWSTYQASLLVKQFLHGSSCSLEKNGKSLVVGWKGTPIVFISAWKFH